MLRRLGILAVALVMTALLWAGWYAYERGFTRKWRGFVTSEFHKRGVDLTLRQLALVPFRGIVARDVRIYSGGDRKRTVAVVDEMLLVIDYASLLREQPFLQALELRDARLSVPLVTGNPHGPAVEVAGLSGRMFFSPQQVHLSRLEADLYGIRVSASGRLVNPQLFGGGGLRDSQGFVRWGERVIEELGKLRFEQGAPTLEVRFTGDLARPEELFAEAEFQSGRVVRAGVALEEVRFRLGLRDQVVELKEFAVRDKVGDLRVSGSASMEEREARVELQSGVDVIRLAKALLPGQQWEDLAGFGSQKLEMTGTWRWGAEPSVALRGHLEVGRFGVRNMVFESLAGDFSYGDGSWSAREVRLAHRSGDLRADVMRVPGEFKARVKSGINPLVLAPLTWGPLAAVLSELEFGRPPKVELEVNGSEMRWDALRMKVEAEAGPCSFRKVQAQGVTATVRLERGRLVVDPFRVVRREGEATGGVEWETGTGVVKLNKVRSSLAAEVWPAWIGPDLGRALEPYRFGRRPVEVTLDGVVAPLASQTRLGIEVSAPAGMDWSFLERQWSVGPATAVFEWSPDRLKIKSLDASLLEGKVRLEADLGLAGKGVSGPLTVHLEQLDFGALMKALTGGDRVKGVVDASGKFVLADEARRMEGEGQVFVRGDVYAVPFLGPLGEILNGIVPKLSMDLTQTMTASFRMDGGAVKTEDFAVQGKGYLLKGHGKLMVFDDSLDFSVRINARGLPGVLLFPVSKLFEYVAEDKLSKPRWRQKILPKL